ncbi:MAG TPA: preprotein translocase subunit SecE [Gemmatimonadaceae bacterium]|nr:preprotein translocase subunit SecE [Gemmatimonadaceae bacterium]
MSVPVQTAPASGPVKRGTQWVAAFYHDVMSEMRKVTWPDWPQVRQLSIGVVLLSLFIGLVIFLMDNVLQLVLVRLLPGLVS